MQTNVEKLDLIWGVSAIAREIGRTDRQAFHMLATGELPAKKVGSRWVIEHSMLIAVFTGEAA